MVHLVVGEVLIPHHCGRGAGLGAADCRQLLLLEKSKKAADNFWETKKGSRYFFKDDLKFLSNIHTYAHHVGPDL